MPSSLASTSFRSPSANIAAGAPRARPVVLFPGQERAFRCCRGGAQQQSQSHRGNILRVSSLSDYGTPFVSSDWKATRGATYPQIPRTRQFFQSLSIDSAEGCLDDLAHPAARVSRFVRERSIAAAPRECAILKNRPARMCDSQKAFAVVQVCLRKR